LGYQSAQFSTTFPNLVAVQEPLKIIFHILRNLYLSKKKKIDRPEKVDSGEGNTITAKLLSIKVICQELIFINTHTHTHTHRHCTRGCAYVTRKN
jgi:hypothetical protein